MRKEISSCVIFYITLPFYNPQPEDKFVHDELVRDESIHLGSG